MDKRESKEASKRSKYTTTYVEDDEHDADSDAPIYDAYMGVSGVGCFHLMTNFTVTEFQNQWLTVRPYVLRKWNVGSGRKAQVSRKDMLFMTLARLKV